MSRSKLLTMTGILFAVLAAAALIGILVIGWIAAAEPGTQKNLQDMAGMSALSAVFFAVLSITAFAVEDAQKGE